MLSSITKKGEIESTLAPLVVLVIHVNIHGVGLMFFLSIFQEEFNLGKPWIEMWTPQDAKDMCWQSFKTLHFWLSDPRSH